MLKKTKLTDKIPIGKYRGKILIDIIDKNPLYVEWLRSHAKDNFAMDNKAITYLVDKLTVMSLLYVKNKVNKKIKKYESY